VSRRRKPKTRGRSPAEKLARSSARDRPRDVERQAKLEEIVTRARLKIVEPILGAARVPAYHGWYLGEQAAYFTMARLAMIEAGVEPPPLNRPWLAKPIWVPE
jgi:hypothetical protein